MESGSALITIFKSIILLIVIGQTSLTSCRQWILGFFGLPNHFLLNILRQVLRRRKGFKLLILFDARPHLEVIYDVEVVVFQTVLDIFPEDYCDVFVLVGRR